MRLVPIYLIVISCSTTELLLIDPEMDLLVLMLRKYRKPDP